MAKTKSAKKKAKSKENVIVRYFRETYIELRKVHWPTREEAWNLTQVVVFVTVSMAVLLGVLDYLFAQELKGIIEGNAIAIGAVVVIVVAGVLTVMILNRQAA